VPKTAAGQDRLVRVEAALLQSSGCGRRAGHRGLELIEAQNGSRGMIVSTKEFDGFEESFGR
jgi:hypothetical protein